MKCQPSKRQSTPKRQPSNITSKNAAASPNEMSKLKVSVTNLIKILRPAQNSRKHYLYIFTVFRALRDYTPFSAKQQEDKISRYWTHRSTLEVISVADKLFEEERYLEVYELLNRIRFSQEVEVLWRIARALYNLGFEDVSKEVRWEMMEEARKVISMALPAGENNANVHKWVAIILDSSSALVSLETRVRNSSVVRDHLVRACYLNPNDFTSNYMLGKWCFEMSQLNWFQRMIAKYLIATEPPRSSYEEAYRYLSRAEEIQPRMFLPNMYLLAKTCIEMRQYYKAKYYLNLTVNLPPRDECEKCLASKANYLIKKLERYDLGKHVLFYDSYHFGFSE